MAAGDLGRFLILLAVGCFALTFVTSVLLQAPAKFRKPSAFGLAAAFAAYAGWAGQAVAPRFYFGGAFLCLALAATALLIAGATAALLGNDNWQAKVPAWSFTAGCICLFGTVVCLGALFVKDQFHYQYVFNHGAQRTELKYKIAGIWSGQEGSFLLWATMSSVFGLLGARIAGIYRTWFTAIFAFFLLALCSILSYESPFVIFPEAFSAALASPLGPTSNGLPIWAPDGQGLPPTLENYWVVIHPPTIFAGFGSLTLLFCMAVAAMLTGNAKDWVAKARPWALVSLAVLGVGLCMGGFWAYETLGWGGFWAWDPVENVSFVPWCFVAALVHGFITQNTQRKWTSTNLLLAGLPFLLFVYGTFMTRSGFLEDSSVHSFAEMNRTALWLLVGFLILVAVGFSTLWLTRGLKLGRGVEPPPVQGVHREGAYRWGSILLAGLGIATAVGMSVPLIQSMIGGKPKAVDEHAYHLILSWFFVPIMLLIAAGPFISWRGMRMRDLLSRLLNIFSISLGLVGILMFLGRRSSWGSVAEEGKFIGFPFGLNVLLFPWIVFLCWLCTFAVVANVWRIVETWKRGRSSIGAFLSHLGVAVLMGGLIVSRGLEYKEKLLVRQDRPAVGQLFEATYLGRTSASDQIYDRDNKLRFRIKGPDETFEARVGQFYNPGPADEMPGQTAWPHIEHTLWHDVYVAAQETFLVGQPITLEVGTITDLGEVQLKYERMEMKGEPGQVGTKFIAHLTASGEEDVATKSAPYMEMKEGDGDHPIRMEQPPVHIAKGIEGRLMSIDAATKSASIQLIFNPPRYPMEIYYKPMTILVWVGTGILTFGGLLSAWYRRRSGPSVPAPKDQTDSTVEDKENAPASVA
jgi:cytochrome c-type biogenesis protein CcmF